MSAKKLIETKFYNYKELTNSTIYDVYELCSSINSGILHAMVNHYKRDYKKFCESRMISGDRINDNFLAITYVDKRPCGFAFTTILKNDNADIYYMGTRADSKGIGVHPITEKNCIQKLGKIGIKSVNTREIKDNVASNKLYGKFNPFDSGRKTSTSTRKTNETRERE